jgi:microcystin-dependent protein
MAKHRDLNSGDVFPESFADAISEFLSTMASTNFALNVVAAGNAVTLPAGAGDAQVALGIMGRWRYNVAAVTSTAIAGGTAAGTYPVYATAQDNNFTQASGGAAVPVPGDPHSFTTPDREIDNTVYAFALEIRTAGVPAAALYRQVANVGWNGFGITGVLPLVGRDDDEVLVGVQLPFTGDGDPVDTRFVLAEGRLIASTSYPVFDALAGGKAPVGKRHKYNGGVDPGGGMVRIPDKRGRSSVGADDMGTARGAAGRLTTAKGHANVAGQNGGLERHAFVIGEVPSHNHGGVTGGPSTVAHNHGFQAVALSGGSGTEAFQGGASNRTDNGFFSGGLSTHTHPVTAQGGGGEHNNMGPYEVDNVVVRVK